MTGGPGVPSGGLGAAGARRWLALSLAATLLLALVSLWTPFSVDQAIFITGGETVASGGVLYRDYWDIKPPGIFLFYAAAGALFGFDEVGVHLLELAWQLAAALAVWAVARRAVVHAAAAAAAPLAVIGSYYALTPPVHATQVEAMMALPIAASLLAAARLSRRPRSLRTCLLLGISAGVTGALKVPYLVFPALFSLFAAVDLRRRQGFAEALRRLPLWTVGGLAGLAAVWAPIVAWFGFEGALAELFWTTFGYPTEALRDVQQAPVDRLAESARWLLRTFLPWAPLTMIGLVALTRLSDGVMAAGTAGWLVLGIAVILVQKTSWWEYHFTLLLAPLGLLATFGLDRLLGAARRLPGARRRVAAALTAALLLLPVAHLARGGAAEAELLWRAARRDAELEGIPLPVRLDEDYLRMWRGTRFLHAPQTSRPGAVYVFGDARIQRLSGRPQAIAVRGHGWDHLPDGMWATLPFELMAARPAYVYVTPYYQRLLRWRAPELWHFLETEYRPIRRIGRGRWLMSLR